MGFIYHRLCFVIIFIGVHNIVYMWPVFNKHKNTNPVSNEESDDSIITYEVFDNLKDNNDLSQLYFNANKADNAYNIDTIFDKNNQPSDSSENGLRRENKYQIDSIESNAYNNSLGNLQNRAGDIKFKVGENAMFSDESSEEEETSSSSEEDHKDIEDISEYLYDESSEQNNSNKDNEMTSGSKRRNGNKKTKVLLNRDKEASTTKNLYYVKVNCENCKVRSRIILHNSTYTNVNPELQNADDLNSIIKSAGDV